MTMEQLVQVLPGKSASLHPSPLEEEGGGKKQGIGEY